MRQLNHKALPEFSHKMQWPSCYCVHHVGHYPTFDTPLTIAVLPVFCVYGDFHSGQDMYSALHVTYT